MPPQPARRPRRVASSGPLRVVGAVLLSTVMLPALTPLSATAQTDRPSPLQVRSVSAWVTPDGSWTARFIAPAVPPDAVLEYRIHQPLRGNAGEQLERLDRITAGGDLTDPLLEAQRRPLTALLSAGELVLTVPLKSRPGASDRAFIPNPGIHPIEVRVLSAAGDVLGQSVLFINRAPAQVRQPMALALLLRATTTVPVGTDLTVTVDDAGRASLTRLTNLLRRAGALEVNVALPPGALDALSIGNDPANQALLEGLRTVGADATMVRSTWVPLNLEAWTRDGADVDVQGSLVAGQQTLARLVGGRFDQRSWPPDPTLGPASLRLLRDGGVDRVVVRPSQVDGSTPVDGSVFTVTGQSGRDAQALAMPDDLTALLQPAAPGAGATAGERAALLMTRLAARRFANSDDRLATVLELDDTADPAVVDAVIDALLEAGAADGGTPPLIEPVPLENAFEGTRRATDSRRNPVVLGLRTPATPSGVLPLSRYLRELRPRVAGRRSMLGSEDPAVVPVAWLLLAAQDRQLPEPSQRAYLDAAAATTDQDFGRITVPRSRTLTVAARQATIPLQYQNGLDRPAEVVVRLRSTRLSFPDGATRRLTLRPGINQVDVAVEVKTAGQFTVNVETSTPDGRVLLGESDVRVRSTAFSGVGFVIMGCALLVLAVWWGRTLRRSRRTRRGAAEDTGVDG